MMSIGETLRRERLKRNLEVEPISQELKISRRMLVAIEEEKFDRLPGGVFTRSFVRQYARYLGLDEQDILARLEQILNPIPETAPLEATAKTTPVSKTTTVKTSSKPVIEVPPVHDWEAVGNGPGRFSWRSPLAALGLVVVAILGCAGVYAWWQQRARHSVVTDTVAAAEPSPAPVYRPPVQTAAASQQQEPVTATITPTNVGDSNPNAPVRVELTAAEPVWVSVKTDGRNVFAGVLDANQRRTVDANNAVVLIIGNAGGVSIVLNGKPIGSVGSKGEVRNIQLTSGGFEIVPPKAPASAPM